MPERPGPDLDIGDIAIEQADTGETQGEPENQTVLAEELSPEETAQQSETDRRVALEVSYRDAAEKIGAARDLAQLNSAPAPPQKPKDPAGQSIEPKVFAAFAAKFHPESVRKPNIVDKLLRFPERRKLAHLGIKNITAYENSARLLREHLVASFSDLCKAEEVDGTIKKNKLRGYVLVGDIPRHENQHELRFQKSNFFRPESDNQKREFGQITDSVENAGEKILLLRDLRLTFDGSELMPSKYSSEQDRARCEALIEIIKSDAEMEGLALLKEQGVQIRSYNLSPDILRQLGSKAAEILPLVQDPERLTKFKELLGTITGGHGSKLVMDIGSLFYAIEVYRQPSAVDLTMTLGSKLDRDVAFFSGIERAILPIANAGLAETFNSLIEKKGFSPLFRYGGAFAKTETDEEVGSLLIDFKRLVDNRSVEQVVNSNCLRSLKTKEDLSFAADLATVLGRLPNEDEIVELRQYLTSLGAEKTPGDGSADQATELLDLVGHPEVLGVISILAKLPGVKDGQVLLSSVAIDQLVSNPDLIDQLKSPHVEKWLSEARAVIGNFQENGIDIGISLTEIVKSLEQYNRFAEHYADPDSGAPYVLSQLKGYSDQPTLDFLRLVTPNIGDATKSLKSPVDSLDTGGTLYRLNLLGLERSDFTLLAEIGAQAGWRTRDLLNPPCISVLRESIGKLNPQKHAELTPIISQIVAENWLGRWSNRTNLAETITRVANNSQPEARWKEIAGNAALLNKAYESGFSTGLDAKLFQAMLARSGDQWRELIGALTDNLGNNSNFQNSRLRDGIGMAMINSATPAKTFDVINERLARVTPGAVDTLTSRLGGEELIALIDRVEPEQLDQYVEIIQKFDDSPSQEIQRLKSQLIPQLLKAKNPAAHFEYIESVFIHNHLPTVGKIYKIFTELYPPGEVEQHFESTPDGLSPALREMRTRERYYTIYKDLLQVHIMSGNYSLQWFVESLAKNEALLGRVEEYTTEELLEDERHQLEDLFQTIEALYYSSQLNSLGQTVEPPSGGDLLSKLTALKESLGVDKGQLLSARLSEMFLRPVGLESFKEALEIMRQAKVQADTRGRELATKVAAGEQIINAGDFLKGVDHVYISNILQNGSVAKEYLGISAVSDMTPFDTDVSLVRDVDTGGGVSSILGNSIASSYGNLSLVFRDRGQFVRNLPGEPVRQEGGYEVFPSARGSDPESIQHWGIRTGIASTEIDCMIMKEVLVNDDKVRENIFYEIAQNGYYIPIMDVAGNLIFTPEQFDAYRRTFAGLERYGNDPLPIRPTSEDQPHYTEIQRLKPIIEQDRQQVESLYDGITIKINDVLNQRGIILTDKYDRSIVGARLLNTGSSGRGTNKPHDYDFDLSLKLDAKDLEQAQTIAEALTSALGAVDNGSHVGKNKDYYQLRLKNGHIGDQLVEIDVGITGNNELSVFISHNAIEEKFAWIRENIGQEVLDDVIANIVYCKEILSDGKAYKRVEHGGFGGIGVENWILANNGNLVDAFVSFWNAAHEESGEKRSFDVFKQSYSILNSAINIAHLDHDDYIKNLRSGGYEAMLRTIESFLTKHKLL